MNSLMVIIPAALLTPPVAAPSNPAAELEKNVLMMLNVVRADPVGYAESLKGYKRFFRGKVISAPGARFDIISEEGTPPVDEAIDFLHARAGADVPPLRDSALLADAARDHALEQGPVGAIGHLGADGGDPGERVRRRGGGVYVSEMITYGSDTAADVVRQLVIDDGVGDRGHRRLLFKANLRFAGVSCGPHSGYRYMCVIDLTSTEDGRGRVQFAGVAGR